MRFLKQIINVKILIIRYGHFSGINRKVQLKYVKPKESKNLSLNELPSAVDDLKATSSILKPTLMLILKWGGELTTAGIYFYYKN